MEESNAVSVTNMNAEQSKSSTTFSVRFLGSMTMNRLYSQTMQPWVMTEIHRQKKCVQEVVFEVVGEAICVSSKEVGDGGNPLLFEHSLRRVTRFAKLHQDPKCFGYLTRELLDDDFVCHVFLADCEDVIQQVFQALREASRGITAKPGPGDITSQPVLDSSCPMVEAGDSDSSKPLYEVKFVGRVKVGGKKVTSDDIDRLAEKIIAELEKRELEKIKREEEVHEARRRRHASEASIGSFSDTMDDADEDLTPPNKPDTHKDILETAELASSHGVCNTEAMLVDRPAHVEGSLRGSIPSVSDLSPKGEEDSKFQSDQPASLQKDLQTVSYPSRDSLVEQDLNNPDLRFFQRGLHSFSLTGPRSRHSSTSDSRRGSAQEPLCGRQRNDSSSSHDSVSSVHARQEVGQAMVLKIGKQEVTLINLDKKMVFLEFKFKDVSSVSQGNRRQDMFGLVARESESHFICYLLRCLSGPVVAEIMGTLQMAFASAYSKRGTPASAAATAATTTTTTTTQHQVCTSCPLYQLHRICQEINALPSQAAYDLLVKKVQLLADHELNELNSLMQVEEPESFEESVEVMISFLRHLCERKQREHVHIPETSKAVKAGVNILEDKHNIFEGLRSKAKKSFTASFENLLNRGKKKEDGCRSVGWTTDSDTSYASKESSITSTPDMSPMSKEFHHNFPSPPASPATFRKRSATVENLSSSPQSDLQLARRRDVNHNKTSSSARNVILSTINSSQSSESSPSSSVSSPQEITTVLSSLRRPSSSWRKAIFNRVCTPQHSGDYGDEEQTVAKLHDADEIRSMWKKAFLETLLFIRLEKEYHSIRARQEEEGTTLSRKLDYQELTPCLIEITAVWEKMLSSQEQDVDEDDEEKQEEGTEKTVSHVRLLEYVKKGVPRSLRGQIWLFLIQQQQHMCGSASDSSFDNANYDDLLKQLTTHQHAILIDLGRTFPNHPYFSTPLGPGQLELFNLLKAYSLLDPEVGYCQGLSFIVGMLLMHMEEISAFHVLKYMMYGLGLRKQFRPNMTALQLKLYQLTRLLHDHYKDVYDHFEAHEISPTLYAAPWFLTLFASQFPLGFVARVFDMIFVQGIDALFKLALMLIGNHRALILQCDTFESVVDFLKITLPEMVQVQMERIINQAFDMDIERELRAYEVEYYVLSEEMTFYSTHRHQQQQQLMQKQDTGTTTEARFPRIEKRRMSIDLEMLYRLENQNRALKNQNQELVEKLQQVESHRESLEETMLAHQVERDKLKSHILALELERAALLTAVSNLQKLVPQESLQQVNLCSPADLPGSSSQSAPASSRRSSTSPAASPGYTADLPSSSSQSAPASSRRSSTSPAASPGYTADLPGSSSQSAPASSRRASTSPAACPGYTADLPGSSSQSAPASSRRSSTSPAGSPGTGMTALKTAGSELETVSGELKDFNQAASMKSMLPSIPAGESTAKDASAPALAADSRTESVAADPPISVFSDKDAKSANMTEDSAISVFTDKDMLPGNIGTDCVTSVLTSYKASSVSTSHKPGAVLFLPTLNFGATETRSSSEPLNNFHMSEVTSNLADATLSYSSTPSSLSSSCVGEEEKSTDDQNVREQAATAQSLPRTDLQHTASTTVSSIRPLYPSRSISNVPSDQPAVGSVTPEERRRAVKVVVQHSTATRNIQHSPSSQR